MNGPIPIEVQRFILTSIDSVPHLEAALMFRRDPSMEWNAKSMSQGLFLSEKHMNEIFNDLYTSGFIEPRKEDPRFYHYQPRSIELNKMIDRLAEVYSRNLIEVSKFIHSKINKQAKQFGDAFKWQKDED